MTHVLSTPTNATLNSDVNAYQAPNRNDKHFKKLTTKLRRKTGQAIADFNMIEEGDKVMVCLSGGKDSYTMLDMLLHMQKSAPIAFSIVAVNLDQKQPGFPEDILPNYLENLGVDYAIIEEDTYSIVVDKVPEGKTTCSLCSRLRRGILYTNAIKMGITKIALGHHRDDMLETLFLNMFHTGRLKSMPPKLTSDDGKNIVIRPLAYCSERDIAEYSTHAEFPIIPCNLCGSQENLQRKQVKLMLEQWNTQFPGRIETMFKALQNVVPSHLADPKAFNFNNLDENDVSEIDGDTAFDPLDLTSQNNALTNEVPITRID